MISLLTDFGAGSEHVGALHAVLAVGAPGVERVDLAHDLPAGDVRGASLVLARLAPLLPGAVHLAVVDPGVGTLRRAAAVAIGRRGRADRTRQRAAGPGGRRDRRGRRGGADAAAARAPPRSTAATCSPPRRRGSHAARRSTDLGEAFDPASLVRPELPAAEVRDGTCAPPRSRSTGSATSQLLARQADLAAAGFTRGDRIWAAVTDRRHPATVGRVFADAAHKGMLVHIDSHGMVAIAVNGGDAARRVGAAIGDEVTLGRWDLAPLRRAAIASATRPALPSANARNSEGSTSSSSSTTGSPASSGMT